MLPISQTTDELGQTVYTLQYPIPHFYQATLIWRLTLDQAPLFESNNASSPAIGEPQSYGVLDQLRIAIESGELTSLELRFEDTIEGTPAFIGYQLPSPIPPTPLDRHGAETVLLDPAQFLGPGAVVSAIALVSAPSLGLRDFPLFVDGYISSPTEISANKTNRVVVQQPQPQPILTNGNWGKREEISTGGAAICPAFRPLHRLCNSVQHPSQDKNTCAIAVFL